MIYVRYSFLLDIHKLEIGKLSNHDSLYTAGYLWYFLLEIIINIVLIPPSTTGAYKLKGSILVEYDFSSYFNWGNTFVETNITVPNWENLTGVNDYDYLLNISVNNENSTNLTTLTVNQFQTQIESGKTTVDLYYSLANIITFFILFRFYHFIRVIHTFSYWSTTKAHAVCRLMNTEANISFGLKAYLKINPFLTLGVGVGFVIFTFGLGVKLFEYYNKQIMDLLDTSDEAINSG